MRALRLAGLVLVGICGAMACTPGGGLSGPPVAVDILDGALRVSPPRGYCIDRGVGQDHADSAVVLMGRCSDAAAVDPAVLTLTVGEAGTAAVLAAGGRAMADYFTSAPGRAALARSGRAADVRVLEAFGKGPNAGQAFLLHVSDRSVGTYWRAVVGVRGRLVTVAVTPATGQPLQSDAGQALLEQTLAALLQANRNPAAP